MTRRGRPATCRVPAHRLAPIDFDLSSTTDLWTEDLQVSVRPMQCPSRSPHVGATAGTAAAGGGSGRGSGSIRWYRPCGLEHPLLFFFSLPLQHDTRIHTQSGGGNGRQFA